MDPEAARNVVRGGDDPATPRAAADDQRQVPQGRLLEFLHCGEKSVEIEVSENRHRINATVPR